MNLANLVIVRTANAKIVTANKYITKRIISMETPKLPQVTPQETKEIIQLANKILLEQIKGDFVEFGCYKGETSVLFQKTLQNFPNPPRMLYLYDSFAGLPEKTIEDASSAGTAFKSGELFVTKREVIERFKKQNLPLPKIKKGFFESLNPNTDVPEKIAFAFLDGDLYSSIKTSLELVVPKLEERGIIIVHDYNNPELPGSSRAVDEFLAKNPNWVFKNRLSLAIMSKKAL